MAITEFQTWHKGDVPDRDGWIVETWTEDDYLGELHHCDSWDEAAAMMKSQLDKGAGQCHVYFRREWR